MVARSRNTSKASGSSRSVSDERKGAAQRQRAAARRVRAYLAVIDDRRPAASRAVAEKTLRERLRLVEQAVANAADPVRRLEFIQQRLDLSRQLDARRRTASDDNSAEAAFIEHARGYGEAKGISYDAWREAGVPAAVLKRAGIRRSTSLRLRST
jgi:hypothetical protein